MSDRATIADAEPFNAFGLRLTFDALSEYTLIIVGVVERTVPVERHVHLSPSFLVDILEAAFAKKLVAH